MLEGNGREWKQSPFWLMFTLSVFGTDNNNYLQVWDSKCPVHTAPYNSGLNEWVTEVRPVFYLWLSPDVTIETVTKVISKKVHPQKILTTFDNYCVNMAKNQQTGWNSMRVSKSWQDFHFWMIHPFNLCPVIDFCKCECCSQSKMHNIGYAVNICPPIFKARYIMQLYSIFSLI